MNVLIMAAGTGGHIFPALSVADELSKNGAKAHWLGTPNGMENALIGDKYPMHTIDMQGLRGKGLARALKLPFALFAATLQSRKILKENAIDAVIGFGGYVTMPGGLAAKWRKTPLFIHEQNAVAGMSNRALAPYADTVLQAFDGVLKGAITVGNPVRQTIESLAPPSERIDPNDQSPLKVLVVGGSLGAKAINEAIVELLKVSDRPLSVQHQCGKNNHNDTLVLYSQADIDTKKHIFQLLPFIDDMAEAYAWADIVVCRAGALTVSEVANAGAAAIFVPLPRAVDDHQTFNAKRLTEQGAGILLPQSDLSGKKLAQILDGLTRKQCLAIAQKAHAHAVPHAAAKIAQRVLQSQSAR